MSCPFTLDGEQCTLTDPRHQEHHRLDNAIRFSDVESDQNQKKAA